MVRPGQTAMRKNGEIAQLTQPSNAYVCKHSKNQNVYRPDEQRFTDYKAIICKSYAHMIQ